MKYANESAKGAARAASYKRSGDDNRSVEEPVYPAGRKVDPSVCIGPLRGEICGNVPINSPAYTGKFKR